MNHPHHRGLLRAAGALLALALLPASALAQATPSLSLTPGTIGPGSASTLALTLTNGATATENVAVTVPLPVGVEVAAAGRAFHTCQGALTALPGASAFTLVGGRLGAFATCTVGVDVTSSIPGVQTITTAEVTSDAGAGGTATIDLTVDAGRPGVSMSVTPATLAPGSTTTVTILIDNTANGSDETHMDFDLHLPAGMELAAPGNIATDCGDGVFTGRLDVSLGGASSGDRVGLDAGAVSAGASCTFLVDLVPSVGGRHVLATELLLDSSSDTAGFAVAEVNSALAAINKQFIDDPAPPGGTTTVRYTIQNLDRNFPATAIGFSDDLDGALAGLAALGALPVDPCGAGSTLTGTTLLSLTGGSLAPEASCTFDVTLTVPAGATSGAYTATTGPLSATLGGVAETYDPASDTLVVEPSPGLTLGFVESSAIPGDEVTLQVQLFNNSDTSDADDLGFGVVLSSFIPLTAAVGPADGFCGPGSSLSSTSFGTDQDGILVAGAALAPGASCTFDVLLTLPTGVATGTYTLEGTALSATIDAATLEGPDASADLRVIAPPSLAFSVSANPVAPGAVGTLDVTLAVAEDSELDYTDIAFTLDLEAALTGLVAQDLPADPCGGGSTLTGTSIVTLAGAALTAGTSCTFAIPVAIPSDAPAGGYTLTIGGLSAIYDGTSVSGGAVSDTLTVAGPEDSVRVEHSYPAVSLAGGTTTITYTLTNEGAAEVTTLFMIHDLDAVVDNMVGISVGTASCGTVTLVSANRTVQLFGGPLAPGESCTFEAQASVPSGTAAGPYLSTLTASGDAGGGFQTIDTQTATLLIADPLVLKKTFPDGTAAPGATTTLEFMLGNAHPDASASDLAFTDDLGAALDGLVATGLPLHDVCGAGSQISGTDVLTFSGGTLAPGGTCTFAVTVAVPDDAANTTAVNLTSELTGTVEGLPLAAPEARAELGVFGAGLSISFDGPVVLGTTATVTYSLENLSLTPLTDLSVGHDLDATVPGLVALGLPTSDDCGAGSVLEGTSFITLTDASLVGRGSCSFQVEVLVPDTAFPGEYAATAGPLRTAGLEIAPEASATLTVLSPPPELAVTVTPEAIVEGQASVLMLTVSNTTNTVPATGLGLSVDLPANVTVATPSNAGLTCVGGTLTAVSGSPGFSYQSGSVAEAGACDVLVDITSAVPGIYDITTGGLVSSADGSGTVTAQAQLTVQPRPGVSAEMSPDTMGTTQLSTLDILVSNVGGTLIDVTNLSVAGTLPAGLVLATPPSAATTCAGGTLVAEAGSGSFSYTDGALGAGAECRVSVQVTAATPGAYVFASQDVTSSSGNSGTVTVSLAVDPPPTVAATFTPERVGSGSTAKLQLAFDHTASATIAANDAAVSLVLPAGLAIADPPNATTSCQAGTVDVTAGEATLAFGDGVIAPANTCRVDVDVVANSPGSHVLTTGELTSSFGSSGTASAALAVDPAPSVVATLAPAVIPAGGTTLLTVTVANTGAILDADDLQIAFALPVGLVVADTPAPALTCTGGTLSAAPGSTTIAYQGGSLAGGATCTLTAAIEGVIPGDYDITSAGVTSSNGGSGSASASLTVEPLPAFTAAFMPALIGASQTSTLTLTIDNSGSSLAADNLTFSHSFPMGLGVADPSNAQTTCGGTVTAAGDNLSLAGGTVAAGATCQLDVDVTGDTTGAYANAFGDLTSDLGNSGSAHATLQVQPPPTLTCAFDPGTLQVGATAVLGCQIDNSTSGVEVSALAASITLPDGLTVASPNGAANTCGGTLTVDGSAVALADGVAPAVGTCSFEVKITSAATGVYSVTSGALASSNGGSPGVDVQLRVVKTPTVAASLNPVLMLRGATSLLTLAIDNAGSTLDVDGLGITATLPAGLTWANPAGEATTCGGTVTVDAGSVSLTGGSLVAGASCNITVSVTGAIAGSFDIAISGLTSDAGDGVATNATLAIDPAPQLSAVVAPTVIGAGAAARVTITIDHTTAQLDATDVALTVDLPTGLVVADPPEATTTCTSGTIVADAGAAAFTLSGATLNAGSSCNLGLALAGEAAGTYNVVTGALTSSSGEALGAAFTVQVITAPVVSAAFAPATVSVAEQTTLSVTLDHTAGKSDATGIDATITLPAGLEPVGLPPEVRSNCASGAVGFEPTPPRVTLTGGTVTAGEVCAVEIDVVARQLGARTVTIDALPTSNGETNPTQATVNIVAPLDARAEFHPDAVVVGETSRLTVTMVASTDGAAATVSWSVDLPAELEVAATPNVATTGCDTAAVTADSGTASLAFEGALVTGSDCVVSVDLTGVAPGMTAFTTGPIATGTSPAAAATAELTVSDAPGEDTGGEDIGGPDAGPGDDTGTPDAGTPDTGSGDDAGPVVDAVDSGSGGEESDSGCNCRTGETGSSGQPVQLLLGLLAFFWFRRRLGRRPGLGWG